VHRQYLNVYFTAIQAFTFAQLKQDLHLFETVVNSDPGDILTMDRILLRDFSQLSFHLLSSQALMRLGLF